MKVLLLIVTTASFFTYFSSNYVNARITVEDTGVLWDPIAVDVELKAYSTKYKVKFRGKNTLEDIIVVKGAKPDCFSCANVVVEPRLVPPGGFFEVSGDIALDPSGGVQAGKIAIFFDNIKTPQYLSYSVRYPAPYKVSVGEYVWGHNRESKIIRLDFDPSSGYRYEGYSIEGDDFRVSEVENSTNSVILDVTPLSKVRTIGTIFFAISYGGLNDPEAAFVVLRVEGDEK